MQSHLYYERPFCLARSALLLFCSAAPLFCADADFLNVFPPSPAIPGLSYSGQLAYTKTYTPSGSTWAPGLDETEVFFAGLTHSESTDNSWQIRMGKGGQLYSIRGLFGESQAPQAQPDAHWIDQIFQFIGVDTTLNLSTPGYAYFVHQAGDYLDDPILTSTFYSPLLASNFDSSTNAAFSLNWGQQAHIPDVNKSGLLYYTRVKDLGSGVIEVTYVVYNFGPDVINYHNAPWGGVRKSVLPVTLGSNPDGSSMVMTGVYGNVAPITLNSTGGWIGWTQTASNPSSPTLVTVYGKDTLPLPSYQSAQGRFRYGTGPTQDDFEVLEMVPEITQPQGTAFYFRVYLVAGVLSKVQTLANSLAPFATRGPVTFTEDTADLEAVYFQTVNGQTVLTTSPQSGQAPALYTFAEPVANSLPLFVLRSTATGDLRLTTNPYELCAPVPFGNSVVYKPYDGTVQYVGFLGYVLPATFANSKAQIYENLLDVVTDRSYLPSSSANATLKAVAGRVNITSLGVAFGGTDIAQNTWIAIKGTGLAPSDLGTNGMTWSAAPDFASGKMPTQLDGVSVTVHGKPAYIFFVSPGQVNALTPLDNTLGPVQIQLTNGANVTPAFTANMKTIAPAFLLNNASTDIVATHADGTLLGPASFSVPGYAYLPAHPSETIVLYGVGCGLPVSPLVQGSATQFGALPVTPAIQIGGTVASVLFAGVVGPGLCQFNVVIPPSAASGENSVLATFGSVAAPQATITVQP